MATRAPVPAPASNDSRLVSWLVGIVVLLVAALVIGGFWMQSRTQQAYELMQQQQQFRTYLTNTRQEAAAHHVPDTAVLEARQTRAYLLEHPAVTPGRGFEHPGVQTTAKAIVQAIDRVRNAGDTRDGSR